jgi:hypothetical protein
VRLLARKLLKKGAGGNPHANTPDHDK